MADVTPSDKIDGVVHVWPGIHRDDRGSFIETYRRQWFPQGREMVQGNRGDRQVGSIVGLHYHLHQADYWYVPYGTARVVLHDLRVGGPTHGVTEVFTIGAGQGDDEHRGVFIPPGIAHGFASLTDVTITYLVDGYYNPADENGVAWNDPAIDADWGIGKPILSDRDRANPRIDDIEPHLLPRFPLRTN